MRNKLTTFLFFTAALFTATVTFSCSGESAESEKTTAATSVNIAGLLGKKMDSPEVKQFLSTLKGTKEIESSMKYPHWMFLEDGVEIVVTTTNTVHAIFFVQKNYMYTGTYSGELPSGIKLTDTRADLEKKLGKGEIDNRFDELSISWKDKNIQIDFNSSDASDMKNTIENIQIRTWEE